MRDTTPPTLRRRALAEALGTGLLVAVVVGSGIAASRLSPSDLGLQLLENAVATAAGLAVLILVLGPVSGAHFNPVISMADWLLGRHRRTGLSGSELAAYLAAQVVGGITGAMLANLMYAEPAVAWSRTGRSGAHLLLAEVVATTGLVLVVVALARTGRTAAAPAAVGVYIGSAYFFTSSTSFANPAVTLGRAFTDTFAGIDPASVPAFVVAQLAGGALGLLVVRGLYPGTQEAAGDVVIPHSATSSPASGPAHSADRRTSDGARS